MKRTVNKRLYIRQMYQPLQPAPSMAQGNITYNELPPDQRLQEFIYCYWQIRTKEPLEHTFRYRVVADGCIDIFFNLENTNKNFAMGFSNGYTEFTLPRTFNYAGIRFLPAAFSRIFRMNASELTDQYASLDAIAPETAGFISNALYADAMLPQLKIAMDSYFLDRINRAAIESDPRICQALFIIFKRRGNIHLAKDLNIGLSRRQLRRLFNRNVGGSIKTFSRVVRFQHVLNTMQASQNYTGYQLPDAGYYDQSHFIKEFKTFYGQTPSDIFT